MMDALKLLAPRKTALERAFDAVVKDIDQPNGGDPLAELRADPCWLMRKAGMEPEQWQIDVLKSTGIDVMLNCCRQSGKTTVTASKALATAMLRPRSTVLVVSRSDRQSGILFRKITDMYEDCGRPVSKSNDMRSELHLENGSRIIPLPGSIDTIVGYSVDLLVIDEAARVPDTFYRMARPMLIRTKGRMIALSTPYGRRGWFFEEWDQGANWLKVMVKAEQCPYITKEELEQERAKLGPRWYAQEYGCSFEADVGSTFHPDDVDAMFREDVDQLWIEGVDGPAPRGESDPFAEDVLPLKIDGLEEEFG